MNLKSSLKRLHEWANNEKMIARWLDLFPKKKKKKRFVFFFFCRSRRQCYRLFSMIASCRKITPRAFFIQFFQASCGRARILRVFTRTATYMSQIFFRLSTRPAGNHTAFPSRPDGNLLVDTTARDRIINKLFYSRAISLFSDTVDR